MKPVIGTIAYKINKITENLDPDIERIKCWHFIDIRMSTINHQVQNLLKNPVQVYSGVDLKSNER